MEFSLSRAPEMFFDEQLWQIFVSYFETPEIALKRIGYPPGLTGYHHERYEMRNSLSKELWWEMDEACAVGRELLRNLQTKFLSEELVATGVPRGRSDPTRQSIPTAEWKRLWPNFAGNWAMSTVGSYDDIELSWHPKDPKSELRERCECLLQTRKAQGEGRRKILIQDAAHYFGEQIPVRIFNAAYKEVFRKRRGRPRSAK
ncbi:hypothetical protein [Bradyrhizobium sp. th.b2]|uniref:hypothetical protein n=1 Tax=Bradyrhizobium sp. th-b2 TaxID=172088 RepID=UPI0012EB5A3A|nr:hypothetical protein [Bradyrhizobium sp. th.b2]